MTIPLTGSYCQLSPSQLCCANELSQCQGLHFQELLKFRSMVRWNESMGLWGGVCLWWGGSQREIAFVVLQPVVLQKFLHVCACKWLLLCVAWKGLCNGIECPNWYMVIHQTCKTGSWSDSGTCPALCAAPRSYVKFGRPMFLAEGAGTVSILVQRITCLQTPVLSYSTLKKKV